MASSKRHCTAVLLVLAAVPAGAARVRADEAFLCGPDTVVYVKADELEAKKRTDSCIASYFGLTVETPDTPSPQVTKRPDPPALKVLEAPEKAERLAPDPTAQRLERSASLAPAAAAAGTDFRNIRVINAASVDAQWFRHKR